MAEQPIPRDTVRRAARAYQAGELETLPPNRPSVRKDAAIVSVENTSGYAIMRGMCVAFEEPMIAPEDNLNEFLTRPAFKAVGAYSISEKHFSRYGVAMEPIGRGEIGKVCVAGVVPAVIRLANGDDSREDTYCDIRMTTGWYAPLVTNFAGAARILYLSEEPYRERENPDGLVYPDTYWGLVRLGNDSPIRVEVEMIETLHGEYANSGGTRVRAKAEVLRWRWNGGDRLEWMNAEQWNAANPPAEGEEPVPRQIITIDRPAGMRPLDMLREGTRLSVQWYPATRVWIPDLPREADFYGIPPENSAGYAAGSVFEAVPDWDPPVDNNRTDAHRHLLQLYVAGSGVVPGASNWQPSRSLWVIQEHVEAGSVEPVIIKKIDDPSSVRIRTTESVSDNTVKHSDSTPIRYSLNRGDTAMTRYNGERPVWVCQEHGRLVYSRFGIYEARVTSIYAGIYVSTNDTSYQDFSNLQVRPPDHYAANQQPDIYGGDVVTVEIDFENIGSTYSGRIINCPMDEKPGSVKTLAQSAPSPGRGWTQDSDVTLKTSTDGTYRLVNWKKKAPEAN